MLDSISHGDATAIEARMATIVPVMQAAVEFGPLALFGDHYQFASGLCTSTFPAAVLMLAPLVPHLPKWAALQLDPSPLAVDLAQLQGDTAVACVQTFILRTATLVLRTSFSFLVLCYRYLPCRRAQCLLSLPERRPSASSSPWTRWWPRWRC